MLQILHKFKISENTAVSSRLNTVYYFPNKILLSLDTADGVSCVHGMNAVHQSSELSEYEGGSKVL